MRVAFVSQPTATALPPSESIAIATLEVARRLAGRDSVEEVAVYSRREPAPPAQVADGVEHRFVSAVNDWRAQKLLAPLWRGRVPLFASPFTHAGFGLAVASDLRRRGGGQIVHVNNTTQYPPLIRRVAPEARTVLHMHCEWLSDLDAGVMARRLRAVDAVIGCSRHVADLARHAHAAAAGRIHVVPHGVDLATFTPPAASPPPGRARILFVSRISPEKGVHVLVDAFAMVASRFPHAELRLVGAEALVARDMLVGISGEETVRRLAELSEPGYLDRCLARLPADVRKRVSLAGVLDRDAIAQEYRDADIFASPSLSEAFGMSLLEAMAAGLPVVAARVGGMVDIVDDGRTGSLVPGGEARALAAALGALIADEPRRRAMGAAGRRRAEADYGWDSVVDRLLEIYHLVLGSPRP